MRLNNKGYMLIEIVVAGVLAIAIGYYLLELTYNFSDKNDDEYESMMLLSDKTVITKSIMGDLEDNTISDIIVSDDDYISFKVNGIGKKLEINKDNKTIEYGKVNDDGSFDKSDTSYYYKKLSNSVVIGDIEFGSGDVAYVKIPISSIYDDNDYGINLLINSMLDESSTVTYCKDFSMSFTIKITLNDDVKNLEDPGEKLFGNEELGIFYLRSDGIYFEGKCDSSLEGCVDGTVSKQVIDFYEDEAGRTSYDLVFVIKFNFRNFYFYYGVYANDNETALWDFEFGRSSDEDGCVSVNNNNFSFGFDASRYGIGGYDYFSNRDLSSESGFRTNWGSWWGSGT